MERCLEPNLKVWVQFKHRDMCEGSPPGRRNRGGEDRMGRSGDRHGTLSRPCWLEQEEYFRELEKFWLENGVELVT